MSLSNFSELKVPKRKCKKVPKRTCQPVYKPITRTYRQKVCQRCEKRPPRAVQVKKPYKDCYYEEPQQKCRPIYKEECTDVEDKICSIEYKEECQDVPEEVCQPVERQKCRQVPMQECKMVDQTHCNPKNECTTKYEMKCKKIPGIKIAFGQNVDISRKTSSRDLTKKLPRILSKNFIPMMML